jgi:hypothetical protein
MSGDGKITSKERLINRRRDDAWSSAMAAIGLPDFETTAQCVKRSQQMLRRLQNHEGTPTELLNRIQLDPKHVADYSDNPGYDGDWLASRSYRAMLIPQALNLLKDHAGPLFFVTVAHPKWELSIGQLKNANIDAVTQWIHRRLRRLRSPILVVGGYEASLRVEVTGHAYWAGHVHLVIAGADEEELKTVLKGERCYLKRKYAKPVTVAPIGNLVKRLGYSTKRIVKRGIAYIGTNGRQQRRELPLATAHQIEFDRWLLSLPAGARTILFGRRLHHGKLRETKQAV